MRAAPRRTENGEVRADLGVIGKRMWWAAFFKIPFSFGSMGRYPQPLPVSHRAVGMGDTLQNFLLERVLFDFSFID